MNRFANRLSVLLFTTTLIGTAAAQEEIPVPGVLDMLVTPTATSVQFAFEAPKNALVVLGASLSPLTQNLRADLPPILAHFDVLHFQVASGWTKLELPRWIATYYAQCGVLDLDSDEIRASRVMTIETAKDAAEAAERVAGAKATVQVDPGDAGLQADYGHQPASDDKK